MGTFERWRRAYGALKDSTTVGLAKVNSDYKNLDIAIVKATNHDECPPNDIHVRRIIVATSFVVPRADVGYCIHTLSRRLKKTKNWIVAVKTLMVFHRILREGDPSFRQDLLIHSRTRHIFQNLDFRDGSSKLAWDCSSWIRSYATFLEERLECYRVLGFDIETERLMTSPGIGKAYSRTKFMNADLLLDQLHAMQQLLYRLIACQPEGAANHNHLIQHALALVLKESFKIYCVINDGIIKLVESFFDLSKRDACKALNIYKKAGKQVEQLGEFYTRGKHLRLTMNIQFPTLSQPPASFIAMMEEYIKGGYSNDSDSNKKNRDIVEERSPYKESDTREIKEVKNKEVLQDQDQEPELKFIPKVEEQVLPLIAIDDNDSPGLTITNPKSVESQDNITQPGCNETEKSSSSDATRSQHTSYYIPGYKYGMQHDLPPQQNFCIVSGGAADIQMQRQQQYMMYEEPYQQLQQQQNILARCNYQQSVNQYATTSIEPNPFGNAINHPKGYHKYSQHV